VCINVIYTIFQKMSVVFIIIMKMVHEDEIKIDIKWKFIIWNRENN